MRRVAYWALVLLVLVATLVVSVAVSDEGDSSREGAQRTAPAPAATAPAETTAGAGAAAQPPAADEAQDTPPALVLVRRRGGLPQRWVERIQRSRRVEAVTKVSRAQRLVTRTTSRTGRTVKRARSGYAVPLDALVIDPSAYARMVAPDDAAAVRRLRSGRVLLSRSSAKLRGVGAGGRLTLSGGRTVRVAGVVEDETARDAEIVFSGADVPARERAAAQLLVAAEDADAVDALVPDDRLTVVAPLLTGAASARGGIVRTMQVKERFGEFAVRLPYGADWIEIDPAWRARNLVTRRVPILGSVTCHRALIAPLRAALGELRRRGLSRLVDVGDYAGCYAPRRIPGSGTLSLHAWGLAVDLNASENPQGAKPTMDRRIVAAFERAGFTWGGRWPTAPDGMHFELHERP